MVRVFVATTFIKNREITREKPNLLVLVIASNNTVGGDIVNDS